MPCSGARAGRSRPTASPAARRAIVPCANSSPAKLKRDAGIACSADDIMIVSGSLQALDLVNQRAAGARRHRADRAGDLSGRAEPADAARRQGGRHPLDDDGMRMDALAAALADHKRRGITPKYIYTIPTVQNPTGVDHAGVSPRGTAEAVAAIRRADLSRTIATPT